MSEYTLYREERKGIDILLSKGYNIIGLHDNLDGALVLLGKEEVIESIQVNIADTRKYLSNIMRQQHLYGENA